MFFLKDNNKNLPKPPYLNNLPTFTSGGIRNFTYGNGKFVAIAGNSVPYQLLVSDDGINWTVTSFLSATFTWGGLNFVNGMFIISQGSNYPVTAYSYNGVNWQYGTGDFSKATYGNGIFVGIQNGASNRLRTSTNGINWTSSDTIDGLLPGSFNCTDIAYGYSPTYGHMFVIVGYIGSPGVNYLFFSTDGLNWQQINLPTTDSWESITYANGKFVATGAETRNIIYSENGTNWSIASRPDSSSSSLIPRKIFFLKNSFYIFGQTSAGQQTYWSSKDGINWQVTNINSGLWTQAAVGDNMAVILKNAAVSGDSAIILQYVGPKINFLKN
jgi:hypothetical protein